MELIDYTKLLNSKDLNYSDRIYEELNDKLKKYIDSKDETNANYCWILIAAYEMREKFHNVYYEIKNMKYESAWTNLWEIQDIIGCIEDNYAVKENEFMLHFIKNIIPEYQKLFPYRFFLSRESVIREEKCNICGRLIKLRSKCDHIPGKLYMGELCKRKIQRFDLKAFAIVRESVDKYTYLKPDDKEYNYQLLDELFSQLTGEFDRFRVDISKVVAPEYRKLGRNENCLCGSGKKYKRCCLETEKEKIDHYQITYLDHKIQNRNIKFISTYK